MAIKQPFLPSFRIRDAQIAVVQSDHRGREGGGVLNQLEGAEVGSRLPLAGPPKLERTERQGNEAEQDDEERESRDVSGPSDSKERIRSHVRDRRDRDDRQRRGRARHETPGGVQVSLMGELVREDGVDFLGPEVAQKRVGNDNPARSAEAHHDGVRSSRLGRGLELEDADDRNSGAVGEGLEPRALPLLLDWPHAVEDWYEEERCEETKDG